MSTAPIVSKVWSFCNTLRDDGVGYGDYLEQLTYLIFLKIRCEFDHSMVTQLIGGYGVMAKILFGIAAVWAVAAAFAGASGFGAPVAAVFVAIGAVYGALGKIAEAVQAGLGWMYNFCGRQRGIHFTLVFWINRFLGILQGFNTWALRCN